MQDIPLSAINESGKLGIGSEMSGVGKVVAPKTDYAQLIKGHLASVVGGITFSHSELASIPEASTALTEVLDERWETASGKVQDKKFNVALLTRTGFQYPASDARPDSSPRPLDLKSNGQMYAAHITDIIRNFTPRGGPFDRVAFTEAVIATSVRLAASNVHPDAISGLVNTVYLMKAAGILDSSTIHNISMGIDLTARLVNLKLLQSGKALEDKQRDCVNVFSTRLLEFSINNFGEKSAFRSQEHPDPPASLVANNTMVQEFVKRISH